jgi:hypothetical protein
MVKKYCQPVEARVFSKQVWGKLKAQQIERTLLSVFPVMCSYTFVLQYDWEMQYYSWSALIVHVC